MNHIAQIPEAQPAVLAALNYLTDDVSRPRTYTFEPPSGEPWSTAVHVPRHLPIRNARQIAAAASLDREGFGILQHRSAVRNFYDEDELRNVYYPEAQHLIAEATGADRVFIFDHTMRRRIPGVPDRAAGLRQPVQRVHVDHTERSGPQRVRDLLPDEADTLLSGRVQIVNLWRPINGPVRDSPLAFCDARSVPKEDLVPQDLVYPHRVGETYGVRFNPQHRWYYVPQMQPDEVLLLKCYDSRTDGRARFAPHSAFLDPTAPPDASPRESIEIRSLAFHSDGPW